MKHTVLTDMGACSDGKAFAEQFATLQEAWNACQEPAWMIWYARRRLDLPKADYVRIAVFAAEKALPIFETRKPDDKRPRAAIDAAKKWIAEPSEENRRAAADAAADADADAAADADAYAYAARKKLKAEVCDFIRSLRFTI